MNDVAFDAVMSRWLAITTGALLVFLVLLVAGLWTMFIVIGYRIGWPAFFVRVTVAVGTIMTLLIGGVTLFCYLYAPRAYLVSRQEVVIQRPVQPIVIPLADIKDVRTVAPAEFKGTIRTFGSDGLFARIGHFHSPALGNFLMYATDTDKAVLIDTAERFVLTPSDPARFVAEVRARMALRGPAPTGPGKAP
jgi:hypothetical protein